MEHERNQRSKQDENCRNAKMYPRALPDVSLGNKEFRCRFLGSNKQFRCNKRGSPNLPDFVAPKICCRYS